MRKRTEKFKKTFFLSGLKYGKSVGNVDNFVCGVGQFKEKTASISSAVF